MPTTTKWGIYYPDGSTLWNPATIFSTEATSVDQAFDAAAKAYGQPYYASTALRDAAYAPAAGMPALVVGMSCSVAGVPQVYLGGARGWNSQVDVLPMMALRRTSVANISTSTWSIVPMDSGGGSIIRTNSGTANQAPVGMSPSTSGITVANSGAFRVDAHTRWNADSRGRRLLSVGTSATDNRHDFGVRSMALGSASGTELSISVEIDASAGQTISILAYQDVGGPFGIVYANLQVRQVA
jgi:hypothetical protein